MDSAQATIRKHDAKIRMVAKKYRRAGIEEDDLLQEGRIALVKAFDRFDPNAGVLFWTFAERFVSLAMRDYVAREATQMRGERVDIEDVIDVASNTTPHDVLISKERKRLFVIAIMELSDEERDLIARRFDDESDFRTIAADLGIGLGTAHSAVRSAIENLIAKARAA